MFAASPAPGRPGGGLVALGALAAMAFGLGGPLLAGAPRPAGEVLEADGVDQAAAERIFASAEAACWLPDLMRARWLDTHPSGVVARPARTARLSFGGPGEFEADLERDFPGLRSSAFGPWLLKLPVTGRGEARDPAARFTPRQPLATVFSESFENGLSGWTLENNTLDLYGWGATTCEARTGSHSADALRGGVNTLSCSDPYGPNVLTKMTHAACEGIQGAPQAWLDAYIHVSTESGHDSLGFFYADGAGQLWGYTFSGSWSAWFHLVFNLKQWYRVGDVTATSCPRVVIEFESDASTATGFGARVDDLTVSTSAPSFLACSFTASPAAGAAPLAVSFTPVVQNASAAATYLWSFGDAAGTTATTRTAAFTYSQAGDYNARLRVEDQGTRAYANAVIHVTTGTGGSPGVPGDCDGNGSISVAELQKVIDMELGVLPPGCGADANGDGTVSLDELHRVVTLFQSQPSSTEQPIASKTIGPSGGTLSGGGLTLTVPAGAFSSDAALSIYRAGAARSADGDLSDTYKLRGLPASLHAPLTLEIEVTGTIPALGANEKLVVFFDSGGTMKSKPPDEAESVVAIPLEASLSGTKVRATVPADWPMPKASADRALSRSGVSPLVTIDTRTGKVKAGKSSEYKTSHFFTFAGANEAGPTMGVLGLLEDNLTRLTALGFSLGCRVDSQTGQFRRIYVDLEPLGTYDKAPLGFHDSRNDPCGHTVGGDLLQITTSYPASDLNVKSTAGHELFHLVQDIYSPGGATANLWLKDASSVWFETILGNPCPSVTSYNEFSWNGLFNSQNSAVDVSDTWFYRTLTREQRHGYGASRFLRYQTDASGAANDPFVYSIWDSIRRGNSEMAAVQAALGRSLPDAWTTFSKDYFFGLTHSAMCYPTWSSFALQRIDDAQSLPKSFSIDAYPLSSISWSLDFTHFKIGTPIPAEISAGGLTEKQTVFVYDTRSHSEVATLTAASPKMPISDLNAQAGADIVLVFVDANLPTAGDPNAQDSTNKVTLQVSGLAGTVSISPPSVTVSPNGTQQFTATVTGTDNKVVAWSVQEGTPGGTISTSGLYTAPGTSGTYHVVAKSPAFPSKDAIARVDVVEPGTDFDVQIIVPETPCANRDSGAIGTFDHYLYSVSWTGANSFIFTATWSQEFTDYDGAIYKRTEEMNGQGTLSSPDRKTLILFQVTQHYKEVLSNRPNMCNGVCTVEDWASATLRNVGKAAEWIPTNWAFSSFGAPARASIVSWSHRNVFSGSRDPFAPDHDCTFTIDESRVDDSSTSIYFVMPASAPSAPRRGEEAGR